MYHTLVYVIEKKDINQTKCFISCFQKCCVVVKNKLHIYHVFKNVLQPKISCQTALNRNFNRFAIALITSSELDLGGKKTI